MFERSERSSRSEFCDATPARASQCSRRAAAIATVLAALPKEMRHLLKRVRAYASPKHDPVVDKARHLGDLAVERARKLTTLRWAWGNEGDVGAVMELGNRWILARLAHPPASKEALERTIPNPRFRRKRLEALWEVFREEAHETQEDSDSSDGLIWNNPGRP